MSGELPASCPSCGSDRVRPIFHGYPRPDQADDLSKLAREGKVVLGGCTAPEPRPRWDCAACRHQWGQPVPTESADPGLLDQQRRQKELLDQMNEKWKKVRTPPGVERLGHPFYLRREGPSPPVCFFGFEAQDSDRVVGLFRTIRAETTYSMARFDKSRGIWHEDPTLIDYFIGSYVNSHEISREEAAEFMKSRGLPQDLLDQPAISREEFEALG